MSGVTPGMQPIDARIAGAAATGRASGWLLGLLWLLLLLGVMGLVGQMRQDEGLTWLLEAISFVVPFLVLSVYTAVSWIRRNFNFLSPFFFPFVFFTLYYALPSLALIRVELPDRTLYANVMYVQVLGLLSFLAGVSLYAIVRRGGPRVVAPPVTQTILHWPVMAGFLAAGAALLVYYGMWSGVTPGLLSGTNVEGLRRSAEIGSGVFKITGEFFIVLGTLFFAARDFRRTGRCRLRIVVLIALVVGLIFMTTGHRATAFYVVLFSIAIYNKYRRISPMLVLAAGAGLFGLIGLADVIKGLDLDDMSVVDFVVHRSCLRYQAVYDLNFTQLVRLIDLGRFELQYGWEYIQNAMVVIPRGLYPDKPLHFDYVLKERLGLTFTGGGAPATPMGSLYLNFHYWGVVLGMIAMGALYHGLFVRFIRERGLFASIIIMMVLAAVVNPANFLMQVLLVLGMGSAIVVTDLVLSGAARRHGTRVAPISGS